MSHDGYMWMEGESSLEWLAEWHNGIRYQELHVPEDHGF